MIIADTKTYQPDDILINKFTAWKQSDKNRQFEFLRYLAICADFLKFWQNYQYIVSIHTGYAYKFNVYRRLATGLATY